MAFSVPPSPFTQWRYTEGNTYLRDNWISIRRYFTAPKFFSAVLAVTTTSDGASLYTSGGLCDTTPDEATKLIVYACLDDDGTHTGSPTSLTAHIRDQGGSTKISSPTPRAVLLPQTVVVGYGTVASGTNPGFQIWVKCNSGTLNVRLDCWAMVGPQ